MWNRGLLFISMAVPSNRLILFRAVVRASGDDLDDVLLVFFAAVMHLDFVIDAFILE